MFGKETAAGGERQPASLSLYSLLLDTPYEIALITRGVGRSAYSWLGPPGLLRGALVAVVFRGRIEIGLVLGEDPAPPQTRLALLWVIPVGAEHSSVRNGIPGHQTGNDAWQQAPVPADSKGRQAGAPVATREEDADLKVLAPQGIAGLETGAPKDGAPGIGSLLLTLCELTTAAPDELAGHLLFEDAAKALRLALSIYDPAALPPALLSRAGALAGLLKPAQGKLLASSELWEPLARLSWTRPVAPLELSLRLSGTPLATRALPALRKHYALDKASASLLGLNQPRESWPGHYLAGLVSPPELRRLPSAKAQAAAGPSAEPAQAGLSWQSAALHPAWEICQRWPRIAALPLRRLQASWEELRQSAPLPGLPSEIGSAIARGEKLLLIAPQAWLLDRLWPQLAQWAERCLRYRPESGPGSTAYLLARLAEPGGLLVASGPGGFKLPAHAHFDRVILLDPTHPQYEPSRSPYLDPRLALLLLLTGHEPLPRLDLLELGLSALDGASSGPSLSLWPPHEALSEAAPQRGQRADTDPLPLPLRQPDTRRLIYFNRLGSGRGLSCAECHNAVACPSCGSLSVYYSQKPAGYNCPVCKWKGRELRCQSCGLGTLAMQSPGLEALAPRAGDIVISGSSHKAPSAQTQRLIGTQSLLDEESGFWPQEIVYMHSESRLGPSSDWPAALDMALRLAALYANPQLQSLHIVSARLAQQFGAKLSSAEIARQFKQEQGLRRLALLPPFGCIYELHCTAASRELLEEARRLLGEALAAHSGTTLLRLGKPFAQSRALRLSGYLANSELSLRELWELRWKLFAAKTTLHIHPLRNPWGL